MKRYWIDTVPKPMNNKWDELYDAAKQVLKPRDISKIIEAGGVAAAVESASGKFMSEYALTQLVPWVFALNAMPSLT